MANTRSSRVDVHVVHVLHVAHVAHVAQAAQAAQLVLADDLGEIHFRSIRVVLRRAEFNLLQYLLQQSPRVVSAQELLAQVLGSSGDGGTVRTHVWEIRRKLGRSTLPLEIQTIRCRGYRALESSFDVDLTEARAESC